MLPLVPAPSHVELTGGPGLRLTGPVGVAAVTGPDLPAVLGALPGAHGRLVPSETDPTVLLRTTPGAAEEAYTLTVTADGAEVAAAGPVGIFRGLTTFLQLLPGGTVPGVGGAAAPVDDAVIPAMEVADAPRYPWRGLMVDVVRHWFGPEVLEEVVDLAATLKLNVLHLHLTDDQAWRLELASRPRLTEVSGTGQVGGGRGGFLTAAQYASLVAYAAARHVTVVPEIDIPGHTNAATHAYGELTPSGEPTPAYTGTEVGFSRITLAEPATLPFLRDVFGELAALTPGLYLHGGGDEAGTMPQPEYREIVETLGEVVTATGKTLVVWQEAAAAPLPPGALVQLWHSGMPTAGVVAAAARGHDVILSPSSRVYLDMSYEPGYPLGQDWSGHVDVRQSWEWDPSAAVPGLDPARVRGVEAALWTETVTTRAELFTMLLPRLAAAAEVAWTAQEARDAGGFDGFAARAAARAPGWRARGWPFHPTAQVPWAGGA